MNRMQYAMKSNQSLQRGATLLVSLIMLVMLTLLAVTAFKLGKGNLQIVGNMQQRNQALIAAQGAIEQVISSTTFITSPANAIASPCGGVANTVCVDVNGSGVTGVKAVVTAKCISVKTIPVSVLNFNNTNDAGCLVGISQQFGVSGAANNTASLCANALWDVQAVATDVLSNAQASVSQGVGVRVPVTATCP
jgi:Tfp pilus assembly protein PilX